MRPTRALSLILALSTFAIPAGAGAQHTAGAASRVTTAAPAEAAQLAFLEGAWEVTVMPKATSLATKIHGMPRLSGTWKVWRAFDGFGIEDELRIIDASGNPNALSNSMRIYDPVQGRWAQTTLDVYRGRFTTATGTWANGEFTLRSVGRDAEGTPYVQRTRFHDITSTSFKYQADRSTDGERTWETAVLRIDAKRVAATAGARASARAGAPR